MSGHSKWAQIKHKKAASDAKRGQLFSKIVREIMLAVRIGGPLPDVNTRLRSAIERARSSGLPKDNIERAIARASGGEEESAALQEFLYEARTHSGISLLIEGITDNKNRTLAEIKQILMNHDAKLADPGNVLWNFEKIGFIELHQEDNGDFSPEAIELRIIESGARDFRTVDNTWFVETDLGDKERVRQELETRGIKIKGSGYDYKPRTFVELPRANLEKNERLLDTLSDHPDIQEVYTNLKDLP